MLVTHGHFDHMGNAVSIAERHRPAAVVGSFEICHWLERQGVENTLPMNLGGTQHVLDCRVSMVRADHSSAISDADTLVPGGPAAGYVVRLPNGYTFYHAGDTALFSDMRLIAELYEPQLAFLPIGDLFTMNPRQAAIACGYLGVDEVVPVHWGTFPTLTGTPGRLAEALAELGSACRVVELDPGEKH
jgi:L-ascorbate metabolism protein UlaG (beta-lactamase superfamily)